jgi:dolichol-phosphate mannosyltransferase
MKTISIVLPSYNEEKMISKSASVIGALLKKENIQYELIYVDDGSVDRTWNEIENVSKQEPRIVGIHFSRNFGKEAAILAGLANATGDCCVVMDCDLQHPPEKIIEMYHMWEQGFEVVEGIKQNRGKESFLHKLSASFFYKIISKAVKIDMSHASDFKLLDRKVVEVLLSMPEKNSFFRALSSWVGFEKTTIEFDVQERLEGESKWSVKSLIQYAITNIVAFSAAPMQFVTIIGVISFFLTIVLGVQTLINYFMGKSVAGFTTVILLILFFGSLIMISLGIVGYYIAKIYEEVKSRPRYIVSKIVRN